MRLPTYEAIQVQFSPVSASSIHHSCDPHEEDLATILRSVGRLWKIGLGSLYLVRGRREYKLAGIQEDWPKQFDAKSVAKRRLTLGDILVMSLSSMIDGGSFLSSSLSGHTWVPLRIVYSYCARHLTPIHQNSYRSENLQFVEINIC